MEIKRYKPLIDKYFWIIWITLFIILIIPTILSLTELVAFLIMIGVFVFCIGITEPCYNFHILKNKSR